MYVTVSLVARDLSTRVILPWTMFNCSEYHTFAKLLEEVQNVSASASTSVVPVYSCTLSKEKDCFPHKE